MAKETFVAYNKWFKYAKSLSNEEFGQLMRAVYIYQLSGEEPKENSLPPVSAVIFLVIKDDLDRDRAKYAETCEKRKKAANARWKKKKSAEEKASGNANAFFASKCICDNEYEYEYEYEYDNDNEYEYEYDDVVENVNENKNDYAADAAADNDNALTRKEATAAAAPENKALKTYEKLIGEVDERVIEVFDAYDLSDELKIRAVEEAHDNGKKFLKYIEGILKGYVRDGVRTLADAESRERSYRSGSIRANRSVQPIQPPKKPTYDYDEMDRLELAHRMKWFYEHEMAGT